MPIGIYILSIFLFFFSFRSTTITSINDRMRTCQLLQGRRKSIISNQYWREKRKRRKKKGEEWKEQHLIFS